MATVWRVLPYSAGNAAVNMATDEAILKAYAEGRVPPTLRFYTWEPGAVSCGRFQHISREVELSACAGLGLDVVRRPTGGRAVLHQGDLTYAVVTGERDGLPTGTLAAYLHLSKGLLAGLTLLGLEAQLYTPKGKANPGAGRNPSCFASPSWYELTLAGRKIAGSAQRRESGAVLQHGAVMLDYQPERLAAILRGSGPSPARAAFYAKNAAGLKEFLPDLTASCLASALTAGFAQALMARMQSGGLTDWESEQIAALEPKYRRIKD